MPSKKHTPLFDGEFADYYEKVGKKEFPFMCPTCMKEIFFAGVVAAIAALTDERKLDAHIDEAISIADFFKRNGDLHDVEGGVPNGTTPTH